MQRNDAHERRAYTRYSASLLAIGLSSIYLVMILANRLFIHWLYTVRYHLPKLILAFKGRW